MSLRYTTSLDGVTAQMLAGFFDGWRTPPSPQRHLEILHGSRHVLLAVDHASAQVVGFINAVGDGCHSAFIPLLEVLPAWRGRGIGTELVRRMLEELGHYRCIDLTCDAELEPFYARLGMTRHSP